MRALVDRCGVKAHVARALDVKRPHAGAFSEVRVRQAGAGGCRGVRQQQQSRMASDGFAMATSAAVAGLYSMDNGFGAAALHGAGGLGASGGRRSGKGGKQELASHEQEVRARLRGSGRVRVFVPCCARVRAVLCARPHTSTPRDTPPPALRCDVRTRRWSVRCTTSRRSLLRRRSATWRTPRHPCPVLAA